MLTYFMTARKPMMSTLNHFIFAKDDRRYILYILFRLHDMTERLSMSKEVMNANKISKKYIHIQ